MCTLEEFESAEILIRIHGSSDSLSFGLQHSQILLVSWLCGLKQMELASTVILTPLARAYADCQTSQAFQEFDKQCLMTKCFFKTFWKPEQKSASQSNNIYSIEFHLETVIININFLHGIQLTLKVMFLHSGSTELFSIGKCNRAMDAAFTKNGVNVSFTPLDWNDSLLWFLSL